MPGSVTQGKEGLWRGGVSTPLPSGVLFFFKEEGWKVKRVCDVHTSFFFLTESSSENDDNSHSVSNQSKKNVKVNFVGIFIYVTAAITAVTTLTSGLPSLTSGTSPATASRIHVHISPLVVAQC